MKGLELSRRFFREWAFPVLNRAVPELMQKVAVGLIGSNSQVLGYDDELSRDHGWGPFFIIWTPDDMKPEDVQRIQDALKLALPGQFGGVPLAARRKMPFEMGDFAIASIGQARRFLTGYEAGPRSDLDWLTIPESRLCEATAGDIFHDPAGLMESWRKSIAYFPDNVWYKRISFTWVMLGVTAQIRRCVERQDVVAGHIWVSWFLEAGMRLGFLLARRYAPWRKWLFRRLKEVWPGDPRMPDLLHDLAGAASLARQETLMLDVLDILGNHASNSGQITAQPLRREAIQHFTPFNFEGFAVAYHKKVKGPLAQLPLDLGPVDMWGSLQAFTAAPPVFMGNAEFIKAIYRSG